LGYAQIVAGQGGITTAVDIAGLSVTVTLVAGRRIRITASGAFFDTVATDALEMDIREGATVLQFAIILPAAASTNTTIEKSVVLTPTAGSHTYKVTCLRAAGTGAVTFNAATTLPAFLLVEDIGAV